MPLINHGAKEAQFKIVYCGTPMGGKTTNLQYAHRQLGSQYCGEMVSLTTSTDRTLFFDLLPVSGFDVRGFKVKLQLYTVPGQVFYNATRQLVLKGADGIVFVADSHPDRMEDNLLSLRNLEQILGQQGRSLEEMPSILQLNKRDLPNAAPVDFMQYLLNARQKPLPVIESVANQGHNVFHTLDTVTQMVLAEFAASLPAAQVGADLRRVSVAGSRGGPAPVPRSGAKVSVP
ncbi:MAG: GTPase domain-containing protein [Verrucomicrobiales bacterium]